MAWNCKFNFTNGNYKKVSAEVKEVLGGEYNGAVFKTLADGFVNAGGDINSLTKEYILEQWPQKNAPQEKISRSSTEENISDVETPSDIIVQYPGRWTRRDAAKPENQDKLFIFTDNTDRNSGNEPVNPESKYAKKYGKRTNSEGVEEERRLSYPKYQTSAVLRGLDNAMPISTQRWYHGEMKREKGRWTNADVEEFKKVIHDEVDDIINEWKTGNYTTIVLPQGGLLAESEITDLHGKERTQIKAALEEELKRLYEAVGVPYTSDATQMQRSEEEQKKANQIKARTEAKQARIQAVKWDRQAADGMGFEVSSAADAFGRQFSAYAAVLDPGTVITIRRGGKRKGIEHTFDVGGYSIEAAYQMLKGYGRNPKGSLLDKDGKVLVSVNGKGKAPISDILKVDIFRNTAAAREAAEDFSYQNAYLPLWQLWAKQHKDLMMELRKKAKGKILTDKYAGTRVSQARALAEILWGTPKTPVSERVQTRYDIQRQNAIRATQQINRSVKAIKKPEGMKLLTRQDNTDKQIANLVNNLNDKGQRTEDNKLLLSFSLSEAAMSPGMELFINPFEEVEDEKKAVNMFIQWILPNDFNSLPKELRVEEQKRNRLRTLLAKGGYKKQTVLTDGSPRNALYARTLRYVIDNFEELRQRYNPVDIQEFGLANHKIRVSLDQQREAGDNRIMRFSPMEIGEELNDGNSVTLERVEDSDNYIITFPDEFGSKFTKTQKDRLYKTIAMAVPEGMTVTIDPAVADDDIMEAFGRITERGFTKIADKPVTLGDGTTGEVGVYKRNGFARERVVTRAPYNIKELWEELKSKDAQPNQAYVLETNESEMSRINHPDILSIPTTHDNSKHGTSYWKDSEFEQFRPYVDRAIENAIQKIDAGYTVVMPKGYMGSGSAALQHYAPRCYAYLQERLEYLKDYGNREHMTNQYLSSSVATVDAVEQSPSENIDLSVDVLQSPRARLRQQFRDIEIQDLSRHISREFLRLADFYTGRYIKETRERLANATSADDIEKLQRKLDKLLNPNTALLQTLNELGVSELKEQVKMQLRNLAEHKVPFRQIEGYEQKYYDAAENGIFELLFEYAVPFIEDASGIRISANQVVQQTEDERNQNDKIEDTEGEDTPEMSWSYNHRLVDPYKSLTKSIRKVISSIPMRDPNDLRQYQRDSIGQTKYWNAQYIYHSIMSRMAKMSMGDIDNFVRVTPVEQLSEKDRKQYPLGKPYFPVLEDMKAQYPWANDLIKELTRFYVPKKRNSEGMTHEEAASDPVKVAEIGNVVSQFYSNFCQQYVPYCIMVDGKIIEENKPTGAASMRQQAVTNYEGNVRFKGIDMIYNSDGSANNDNIAALVEKVDDIRKRVSGSTKFWEDIKQLKKEFDGSSLFDAYEAASETVADLCMELVDALKACGVVMSNFDVFCIAMDPKGAGLGELTSELEGALNAIKGLPEDEHIFESSFQVRKSNEAGKKYDTPAFYWNNFFRKFGDYVTENEYESSFRTLGKSRYSYTYPSYMSMTMINLTNPDDEIRRKYIEENFMPYDWFYNKEKGEFRNKFLEQLYKGGNLNADGKTNGYYGMGHDLICKKDGGKEKEYSDWTPQDIYELMFRELAFPSNAESGNFLIPVLSDSRICKVIQAHKVNADEAVDIMASVVKQELGRMKLVSQRNTIFRMQDIEDKMASGSELSAADNKFYNDNQDFYQKYKAQHPERLQEVENFDKNGSKFCFFPELNDYMMSFSAAQAQGNEFFQKVIRVLSRDINKPSTNRVDLKTVLSALQNMSEENFSSKAEAVGLTTQYAWEDNGAMHTMTREQVIDRVISEAVQSVMENKAMDFFWQWRPSKNNEGRINEALLSGILANDEELRKEYDMVWKEGTENAPLTPADIKAKRDFIDKAYAKARDFYFQHTANMSQFIQLMATDIAYYKDPTTFKGSVDFAKRWKEVYGAGMKLNTNSKFGKKVERNIILKDRVRRSHSYDVFGSVLQKAIDEGRILDVEADAVLDKMKGITGTDAQAFRSLTSFRDLMDMVGRNSEELAQSIENLRNGTWTMKDFYTVYNTVKPFSFGPEDQDSGIGDIHMRTMVQHKNSEAVLLAIYDTLIGSHEEDDNYSARLKGINRAMEEIELVDDEGNVMTYDNGEPMKAIDVAQYHSAVKVGAHGVIDINYSRDKLRAAQEAGGIKIGGKEVDIRPTDSYYDVEKKLSKLLDGGEISFDDYEKAMDYFEPDADEVFEIIRSSIYKNGDETLGYDNQVLHRLPYAYYSIQQPTDDHYNDNDAATFGSQPRHIIMADLPADFEIEVNGKKYNREDIRERYNSLLVANLIDSYEKEIEPLFKDTDKKKSAIERLRDRLLPIIESNPKYGKQMKDALQIVTDSNGRKTFALPMNNITLTQQLEEVITSMFKNAIHRQKIAGGNVILAADIGYSNKLKVRGKRDKNGKLISIEGVECFLPAHSKAMFEPYMEERIGEDGEKYYVLDPEKLAEDGLDKLIGYRIPTEGLYSIMPLIIKGFLPQQSGSSIVVAQEVTTLTGSDNDVDKMYLMMKAINKELKAIRTPKDAHVLEMTKQQRDNELIDIFFGITTHPQMTHLWAHPGNFDTLTLNAKRLRILKTPQLRSIFMRNAGLSTQDRLITALSKDLTQKQYNELYRRVMEIPEGEKVSDKSLMDIVLDFTNKYVSPLSPCYPDTFVEMHQSYMAGVAEKGIFANNTLDHAKLQWANVRILPTHTFTFEGAKIEKMDERTVRRKRNGKAYDHYISSDCAECSAAAVDNGKDPVLADLNSNKQTATFFGFLIRLGLGIDGAALLLSQPAVDYNIRTVGKVNANKNLEREISKIAKWLKEHNFDLQDGRFNWREHNFTTQELYMNIVGERLPDLLKHGGDAGTVERMASLYNTYNLILNLKAMNDAMREPRNVLHYDSPNHAADTSVGGVIEQVKAVEELNSREELPEFDRYFSGDDQLLVYNLEEKTLGKKKEGKKFESLKDPIKLSGPKYQMFEALMHSELPITQAFYTLGIEKIRKEIAPQFAFGRKEMQTLTDRLWKFMQSRYIFRSEDRRKIISQMYRDWVVYNLSRTSLFGDDGNMTFDQKRQYYLYEYPKKLLELKATVPALNDIDAIRRLSVRDGQIIMNRQGKTTTTLRDFIMDSFDALQQTDDPEVQQVAKDLFMYTYYLNGFEFSYMSFGNMMGTEFQRAFPEYIQALRDMNTNPITEADLDNFFEQFVVKRGNMGLVPTITYKTSALRSEALQRGIHNTGRKIEEYGSIDEVPEFVFAAGMAGSRVSNTLLRFSPELTDLYESVVYVPLRTNTSLHFNAGQTLDEMMDVVYDQELIDANRKVGSKKRNSNSVQYDRYQSTRSQKDTSNERDTNTPEPSESGDSSVGAAIDDDASEMGDASMDKAVGISSNEDVETDYDEYDAAMRNRNTAEATQKEDSDIEEAQRKLEEDNEGKGLCQIP